MQADFIVNGGVKLLLIPQTPAEEELVKQLLRQDNELTEIRGQVQVLNKSIKNGLLISAKSTKIEIKTEEQTSSNEGKEKDL